MKKILIIMLILVIGIINVKGQCTCNYSYNGTTEILTFTNLSTVSNAHFYWDFGDGDGSNVMNPIHIFPDDGRYLVTLYGLDTINNCTDFFESWINVNKPDTIDCNLLLFDTIQNYSGTNFLVTTNLSSNCGNLSIDCDAGPGMNQAWSIGLFNWSHSLFLDRLQAYTNDSIHGWGILKEYYKTVPYNYLSNNNYQNCSANFEIKTSSQTNGELVTFTRKSSHIDQVNPFLVDQINPF